MHERLDPMRRRGPSCEVSANACVDCMTSVAISPATMRLVMLLTKDGTGLAMPRCAGNGSQVTAR